jgi:flagellar hook-associated protein 3 FlgL
MRVTNRMVIDSVLKNISTTSKRLQEIQESISSGKNINKPSDDPIGAAHTLHYREILSKTDRYAKNIAWGESWLEITDSALGQTNELLLRAKEIAISQSSATADASTRADSAAEVGQLFEQLLQVANTELNGRHIFAGHKTDAPPFSRDGSYTGDSGEVLIMIGPETDMSINTGGDKAFKGAGGGEDVFALLQGLKSALENNDAPAIGEALDGLSKVQKLINTERTGVGARLNRLDIMNQSLENLKLRTELLISKTEDVDLTEAAVALAERTNFYQASLAVLSSIMKVSLVDFLR